MNDYNYFNYQRRHSSIVQIGKTPLGGSYPIRLQSMTTTPTADTNASVDQCRKIIRAGADYVRLTAQGTKEAENLRNIRKQLHAERRYTPLVADIHFNPQVADVAAEIVEKVRINPGNYVDSARTFKHIEYTDEEYAAELQKIEDRFIPFLQICREHHTAIRIGVNHGSLSDRIMSRYGDTPRGIVESCMEFLRICKRENFFDVVLSIKASIPGIMVRSVRLLVQTMDAEGMHYPIHLGVTEAGEGEDGRIKSAVGIGALLTDGIGDTIRVSLSEPPEQEIPVARKLRDYIISRADSRPVGGRIAAGFNYVDPNRRITNAVGNIGGTNLPIVISENIDKNAENDQPVPDYIYCGDNLPKSSRRIPGVGYIVDASCWTGEDGTYPCFTNRMKAQITAYDAPAKFMFLPCSALDDELIQLLQEHPEVIIIAQNVLPNKPGEMRSLIHRMMRSGLKNPVIAFSSLTHNAAEIEDYQLECAADMGVLFIDGLCDGIYLSNETPHGERELPADIPQHTSFAILQAVGLRRTRPEYISCPGCGRTLYDLSGTIARIKKATAGLKNLKIAVMGCIVNGPGEMADADYGYVGAAKGKISLYRKSQCIEKNIPEAEAVDRLLSLLKKDGVL